MKRHNGEGSWAKIMIKGVPYFRYRKKYEGMESAKSFYAKTEKEVREKVAAFEKTYKPFGSKYTEEITVYDYGIRYVNKLRTTLTPAGFDGYHHILRVRLKDFKDYNLANRYIHNTKKEHAEAYVSALIAKEYAPKTIKKTVGLIKAIFADAVNNGLVDANPFDGVRLPTPVKKHKNFMSLEQHADFCRIALHKEQQNERWNHHVPIGEYTYGIKGLTLAVIANTGMRVSEAIALTWERINLDKRIIQICDNVSIAAVRRADGSEIKDEQGHVVKQTIVKEPKSAAGIRVVPMTNVAYNILLELSATKHGSKDIVFPKEDGDYLTKDMLRHTCQCIGKRIGLPNLTTHNLRHSFGAIVIHQEHVDPQVASKLLGHKDVSTTYNYYSDVINEVLAESIEIFNN